MADLSRHGSNAVSRHSSTGAVSKHSSTGTAADVCFATAKDRTDFLREEVRPTLEDLAVAFYSTVPPPEDIVSFFIDTIMSKHGLKEPKTGDLDEFEQEEADALAERVAALREQVEGFEK